MTTSTSNLWNKFERDREYRRAFLVSQFKRMVPFQIQALRKQRGWSQEQLAEASGLTQGAISRAEDPDYGNLTVNTILRIANGFDVAFIGKFAPYGELDDWFNQLSGKIYVPAFDEENALRQAKLIAKSGPASNRWNYENKSSNVSMNYGQENVIVFDKLRHGLQGKEQRLGRAA